MRPSTRRRPSRERFGPQNALWFGGVGGWGGGIATGGHCQEWLGGGSGDSPDICDLSSVTGILSHVTGNLSLITCHQVWTPHPRRQVTRRGRGGGVVRGEARVEQEVEQEVEQGVEEVQRTGYGYTRDSLEDLRAGGQREVSREPLFEPHPPGLVEEVGEELDDDGGGEMQEGDGGGEVEEGVGGGELAYLARRPEASVTLADQRRAGRTGYGFTRWARGPVFYYPTRYK